jgi:hypothetical protein
MPEAAQHWGGDSSVANVPLGSPRSTTLYICLTSAWGFVGVDYLIPWFLWTYMAHKKSTGKNGEGFSWTQILSHRYTFLWNQVTMTRFCYIRYCTLSLWGGHTSWHLHRDYFWSILHLHLISKHSWFVHQSSMGQLPAQTSNSGKGETWLGNGGWILPTKYVFQKTKIYSWVFQLYFILETLQCIRKHLFICPLFNNIFQYLRLYSIEWRGNKWMMNGKWRRRWWSQPNLRYCPGIYLEGLKKTQKTQSGLQVSRPRFEPGTSRIQSVNHSTMTFSWKGPKLNNVLTGLFNNKTPSRF